MTLLNQAFANTDKSIVAEPTTWKTLNSEFSPVLKNNIETNKACLADVVVINIIANEYENSLLNMAIVAPTKLETSNLKYALTDDSLTLADEAGLGETNEFNHKSAAFLTTDSNPNPLATPKAESKTKPATEAYFLKLSSRNINTKYLSMIIGLACMLIFTGVQAYTYLINSTTPVVSLPKALAAKPAIAKIPPTTSYTAKYKLDVPVISKKIATEIATEIVSTKELPSKNLPVQLITHVPTATVDATLLEAYRALNHGEYMVAQQQYRQVLQRDMHNIDALLGMATIAHQQGQNADAQAWNQKVLEIDPRNDIALTSLARLQNNKSLSSENLNNKNLGSEDLVHEDLINSESKIKNLLALQPEAASFHATLGNLYADQNLWPAAQEAFYSACRFAPNNPDYAFNLAISLDQMAKYNLALKQYQRALTLLNQLGVNSPDRASLEARVKLLEPFND